MKKFKILLASDLYYPYPGGISEHVHNLAIGLKELGHEVKVLTAKYKSNSFEFKDPDWVVRVGRGVKFPINRSFSSITFSMKITKRVKELLESENFDIVHVHGSLAPTLPLVTIFYSKSVNFITFHAAHDYSKAYELFKPILLKVFEKIHGLIAVSEVARDSVARHFPGNYRIIPNGVDVKRFSPNVLPIPELLEGNFKNILFVGRPEPRKGLKFLIKAMPLILKEIKNARLLIIGTGPLLAYYRSFVKEEFRENVKFLGAIPPKDLPRYYRSSHVFVSPATGSESFGIVLLEAMASGIPVVASDIPGYRQVIEDGKQGFFAKPGNIRDLADKIILLLKNPELSQKLGIEGRKRAVEKFAWPKIIKDLEEYYYEIWEAYKNGQNYAR